MELSPAAGAEHCPDKIIASELSYQAENGVTDLEPLDLENICYPGYEEYDQALCNQKLVMMTLEDDDYAYMQGNDWETG